MIQTAGRAARHEQGRVIFYADVMTQSLNEGLGYLSVPQRKQKAYNKKHGITPRSVMRPVQESLRVKKEEEDELAVAEDVSSKDAKKLAKQLEKEMIEAVRKLEFEKAALSFHKIKSHSCGEREVKKSFKVNRSVATTKRNMVGEGNLIQKSSLLKIILLISALATAKFFFSLLLLKKRQLLFFFDKIEINGAVDVFVKPGTRNQEAFVYADSSVINDIGLNVRERTLFIEAKNTFDISRRHHF